MSDTTKFTIGSEVACEDGACGRLSRVVIDPVARALTHLVVEPKRAQGITRLVPVDLVESTEETILLRCTTTEFEGLEPAEETQFLPGASKQWAYAPGEVVSWPYYGLGMGGMGIGGTGLGNLDAGPQVITRDRVPVGEVAVRRGERVHATDGDIGRVQGLVVDPTDHHVTHVLLEEGHIWGKKEVAIPIRAVTGVDDGVRLSLTKDEVADLPAVEIDHAD